MPKVRGKEFSCDNGHNLFHIEINEDESLTIRCWSSKCTWAPIRVKPEPGVL